MNRQEFLLKLLKDYHEEDSSLAGCKRKREKNFSHDGMNVRFKVEKTAEYIVTITVENNEIISSTIPELERAIRKNFTIKG